MFLAAAVLYTRSLPGAGRRKRRHRAVEDPEMKKWLGLFGLLGAIGAAVMFFRRQRDDDEFLDEELE